MNENKQSYANRKVAIMIENKAKSMGKKNGVGDIVVILPNKVLFIELKREKRTLKNGTKSKAGVYISETQKAFISQVCKSSVCDGRICFGFNEAKEFIMNEINIEIKKVAD